MFRGSVLTCLALAGLCAVAPARGDGRKDALALQEALQSAIQEAEPAVACVLVSRSEAYAKYRTSPVSDNPGKLDGFSLSLLDQHYGKGDKAETDRRKKLDMAQPRYIPESYGSGVVIDGSGLILTNYHVVRDAAKIFVRLTGDKESYADIHAADPRSDLAVLRLLTPPNGLTAIKLGDASKVRKGQMALSIANPFAAGFRDGSPSASWGIISNIRRRAPDTLTEQERTNELERKKTLHHYGTLLQTDARLNLGCSGGALIDLKGELIGLTTSLAAISGSETAGGFAVPIDATMRRIIEVLKRGEEVEYGFLGVSLFDDHRRGKGVPVERVTAWSPAYRAGLRDRDVILSVNDTPVTENDDIFLTVGTLPAGSEARLEVRNREGTRTIPVTLAKYYVPGTIIASRKPAAVRGLRVDHVSVWYQTAPTLPDMPQNSLSGVVIREVQSGSAAATALLKVNDVVTHVNGTAVNSPTDFYREAQKAKGPLELTLTPSRPVKLN
ncbi:MAG: PDZ domain-containing protein [Gemmataceae bacterium]|nr:PDZ domain-containing protein [Gemmataceae bacterium]